MMEPTEQDQMDIDSELQFHQEWQQWSEELEPEGEEELDAYLIALAEYYGNRYSEGDDVEERGVTADEADDIYRRRYRAGL